MAKALVIGDPHFKVSSQALVVQFLDWLHGLVKELKPDFVVNLGDTFHTHNVIRSEIMALIVSHLKWMEAHGPEYYILVGNHDMAHHKTPDIHAWLPFKGGDAKIVDEPYWYKDVAFLPYIDDPGQFEKVLTEAMKEHSTIFCHQTFRGANYGFIKAKEGAVVPENYKGQIISGHVHKNHQLGCVWYPGTPYAQEASDNNEIKGIFLYDLESRETTFFKSPMPQWVTSKATPADFEQVVRKMSKSDKNHLVVEGPGPEVAAVVDSKLFRDLKKEYGFSVKKQSTSSVKSSSAIKKVSTVEDAVVEYIDRIYDGAVDKALLKEKCLAALH